RFKDTSGWHSMFALQVVPARHIEPGLRPAMSGEHGSATTALSSEAPPSRVRASDKQTRDPSQSAGTFDPPPPPHPRTDKPTKNPNRSERLLSTELILAALENEAIILTIYSDHRLAGAKARRGNPRA